MTEKSEQKTGTEEAISDKERIDKGQVLARIIIEVLGAPKEHVEEAVQLVVDRAHKTDKLDVVSESTFEAEEKGKLFSTFSELEIWFHDVDNLSKFLFDFTPSSVEIMQPTTLALKANFMSGFFNDFLLKMHDLGIKLKDESAKAQLLQKNADVLVRNFLNFALTEPKNSEQLGGILGIPKENIEAILANFEKAGLLEKKDDVYILKKKD